jgi:hypothetical protein
LSGDICTTANRAQSALPHRKAAALVLSRFKFLLYRLAANQVFRTDGLVNLSNIVLVAFSARDVRKLRILSFFGEALILPYYCFQHETLWAPLFWSVAFIAVNAVRIVATALEWRPVVLSEKEDQLYRIAFTSIEKKNF